MARPVRRTPWEDRFSQPTEQEVLSHYNRQLTGCATGARKALRTALTSTERLEWKGIPWRWTFVYNSPIPNISAFLVPLPTSPRVVLTLPGTLAAQLATRQSPRILRDAISAAVGVGGNLWPTWDIETRSRADELAEALGMIRDSVMANAEVA
ncbi:MAG: hypothetical protein KF912_13335 [Phycisphaeraceae bacterium]|nr:hypothetical protein [Phycisphaeraceae bacterium]MBX3368289.1 hypothetical protein [Phycisphaeraceae bacterium]QYK48926.1 MAG: hypothetical protein KF838_03525 [Phycisphaeraceae bacterium]